MKRWQQVALLRFATGSGCSLPDARRQLSPLLRSTTGVDLQAFAEAALCDGLLAKQSGRIRTTDAGRVAAFRDFATSPGPRISWRQVKARYLSALALHLQHALDEKGLERLGRVAGLRTELLRAAYVPTLPPVPTRAELEEELGWALLPGVSKKTAARVQGLRPFNATWKNVCAILCYEAAGFETVPKSYDHAFNALAAKVAGAASVHAGPLYAAVHARLLQDEPERPALRVAAPRAQGPEHTSSPAPQPASASVSTPSLPVHLRQVLSKAGGRIGSDKVFVWRAFQALEGEAELEDFKAQLLRAHMAGDVELARADLPHLYPPEDVRMSEIAHGEARFHFIRDRGQQ